VDWRWTHELAIPANEPKAMFFLLAGSYFPDWMWGPPAYTDCFMRGCLGTRDYGLASMHSFSNLPQSGPWRLDRLALGWHLGAVLQDTLRWNPSQSCRTVYILGEATLHGYALGPASNLVGSPQANQVYLSWTAAAETVDGYYVYRGLDLESASRNGPLNANLVSGTSYVDYNVPVGVHVYAVRACKLTHTGAGSFHNLSQADWTSVEVGQ
jgi:hypothetical protein